ncbi:MAG TPA: hypothetical protein VF854_04645 [Azonexus sp.]
MHCLQRSVVIDRLAAMVSNSPVTSILIAFVILAGSCGGLLLTVSFRHHLPSHHEEKDTQELLKVATGMLATLVALILGLLVSSAKDTLDKATASISRSGAQIITLNRMLVNYGPEAQPARELLRRNLADSIARVWSGNSHRSAIANSQDTRALDEVRESIGKLTPGDERQRRLQANAAREADMLAEGRWLLFEQMQNPLPQVFLIVIGLWLVLLFVGLGLLAPRNSTAVIALVICALSMSAAIFVILEMNQPFDGIIKVSSAPLEAALAVISK